jgi:hypothetical protein
MSGLTGYGIGGFGGFGGGPTGGVFVPVAAAVGITPGCCWDACRGGGRKLVLRGGRGGTAGVTPGMIDGEGGGGAIADLGPEPALVRFTNGLELLGGELDGRGAVSGSEPSSLERVDPLKVGFALFGAEVARLAKGLFEWKLGVEGGSLAAAEEMEETETRSVWVVLGVAGAERLGGIGGGGERLCGSCAENKRYETMAAVIRKDGSHVRCAELKGRGGTGGDLRGEFCATEMKG